MKNIRCELCSKETVPGARLCASCAEMVQRIANANDAVTRNESEAQHEPGSLKERSERAKALAEKLTPVIMG